jgi:hypothetical protein
VPDAGVGAEAVCVGGGAVRGGSTLATSGGFGSTFAVAGVVTGGRFVEGVVAAVAVAVAVAVGGAAVALAGIAGVVGAVTTLAVLDAVAEGRDGGSAAEGSALLVEEPAEVPCVTTTLPAWRHRTKPAIPVPASTKQPTSTPTRSPVELFGRVPAPVRCHVFPVCW